MLMNRKSTPHRCEDKAIYLCPNKQSSFTLVPELSFVFVCVCVCAHADFVVFEVFLLCKKT